MPRWLLETSFPNRNETTRVLMLRGSEPGASKGKKKYNSFKIIE
jgi:hypothetical protein